LHTLLCKHLIQLFSIISKGELDMTIKEKLSLLEDLLDMEKGTLKVEDELEQIEQWDSIAAISLIAMFDDIFGMLILSDEVKEFKTVNDIINKME
jgi:acyl carrier protein